MLQTLDKLRVLVVDDVRESCMFAGTSVRSAGVKDVMLADSVENAVRIFNEKTPDIVLASWEMKPVTGLQFTQQLRAPASPNFAVPIIMMVSLVSIQMVAEARDAGVTEFLCRPFSAKHVTVRLSSVVNNPRKFIATSSYRGPCRRRTKMDGYAGPFRRAADPK